MSSKLQNNVEVKPVYGILPKNICVNGFNCKNPESCNRRQRMHPKFIVEQKLCTYNLALRC